MEVTFFKTKINVSFVFFALITIMITFDRTGLCIPALIAVFVHETSHLFFMKKYGCSPKEINLVPGSVSIVCPCVLERNKENIILLAGPLCNVAFALIFYFLYSITGSIFLLKNCVVQSVVAAYNLLPSKGLDGGSLLFNFLLKGISVRKAVIITNFISLFIAVLFIAFGSVMFLKCKNNPSLLIFGLYILILTVIKN